MKLAVNTAKLLRNVPLPDEIGTVHDHAIVLDFGSRNTRIGFSGDDAPRLIYPTVVSRRAQAGGAETGAAAASQHADCFAKAHAQRADKGAQLTNVVRGGLVQDWNAMELLLQNIYDRLNLRGDPNAPLIIAESTLAPKEHRERMTEILFERVGAQAVYFAPTPALSLYASGRSTGLVLECNSATSCAVPVYEGLSLFHASMQMDVGGDHLTELFTTNALSNQMRLLPPAPYAFEVAEYLKMKHCALRPDRASFNVLAQQLQTGSAAAAAETVEHQLPDGSIVTLDAERYRVAEALFDPSLLAAAGATSLIPPAPFTTARCGIHHLAAAAVAKCDADTIPLFLSNIVLAGGGTLVKNFPERVLRELQGERPNDKLRVHAATERQHAAWTGGSILASLPTFQELFVTRAEYEACGADVRRSLTQMKCF